MNEHEHGDERETERDARHAERDADRDARRAERDARRAERHRIRAEIRSKLGDDLRQRIGDEVRQGLRQGMRGGSFAFGFGDLIGRPDGGSEASETIEQRFEVHAMPKLRISNVSGETEVTVGGATEVFVRARKRVRGWSEDRARRILENVEVRMEQTGDEIVIEPRLYQQERGWPELFRGGRVAVDLDIRVPRESQLEVRTVSGELSVTGTRGPADLQSVSGEIDLVDVQGPLRLRTVSGDVNATAYAGQVEANSVSGELEFERCRVRTPDIVTVSGDVEIDAVYMPAGGAEGRIKTVSGDVELALADADAEIDFKTISGDAEIDGPARIEKSGRRDRRIVLGTGGPHLRVKTVSGDLQARRAVGPEAGAEPTATEEESMPMGAPAPDASAAAPSGAAREILERVARGELSVDDAAAALDAAR